MIYVRNFIFLPIFYCFSVLFLTNKITMMMMMMVVVMINVWLASIVSVLCIANLNLQILICRLMY